MECEMEVAAEFGSYLGGEALLLHGHNYGVTMRSKKIGVRKHFSHGAYSCESSSK